MIYDAHIFLVVFAPTIDTSAFAFSIVVRIHPELSLVSSVILYLLHF